MKANYTIYVNRRHFSKHNTNIWKKLLFFKIFLEFSSEVEFLEMVMLRRIPVFCFHALNLFDVWMIIFY